MRWIVTALAVLLSAGALAAPPAPAEPTSCDDPYCVPGIAPGAVLGAPCADTSYFVFGTTSWGRLVFCGSPRRYEPRYFRSPPLVGIKQLGDDCANYQNDVAQAPDGMFLTCAIDRGATRWVRGDA